MLTVIRTSIRPHISIAFWNFKQEQLDKIKSTYDDTGKRISFKISISEDGLEEIRETIWDHTHSQLEYDNEFASYWRERNQYNQAFRILSDVVFLNS
jgi:hypothetical protein